MDHLVRVQVTGPLPIVSVVGYRDEDEVLFGRDGRPVYDADGNPKTETVKVEITESVSAPGFAFLDPEKTNIRALVRGRLVQIPPLPKAKKAKEG